ncbi:unnamed protein product, partial [Phaeothamnion confervicola]
MTQDAPSKIDLATNARSAADLLRVLANPHRLQVLCGLRTGELSVGQIADHVDLSQSALSQHLARLRLDRVVATRRQGQTIYYRIADPDVMTVLAVVSG